MLLPSQFQHCRAFARYAILRKTHSTVPPPLSFRRRDFHESQTFVFCVPHCVTGGETRRRPPHSALSTFFPGGVAALAHFLLRNMHTFPLSKTTKNYVTIFWAFSPPFVGKGKSIGGVSLSFLFPLSSVLERKISSNYAHPFFWRRRKRGKEQNPRLPLAHVGLGGERGEKKKVFPPPPVREKHVSKGSSPILRPPAGPRGGKGEPLFHLFLLFRFLLCVRGGGKEKGKGG